MRTPAVLVHTVHTGVYLWACVCSSAGTGTNTGGVREEGQVGTC